MRFLVANDERLSSQGDHIEGSPRVDEGEKIIYEVLLDWFIIPS
jgi:hypothetical protein